MTDKQPEALRLAGLLELAPEDGVEPQTTEDAAAELRRQHTRIAELEAQLESIGAGAGSEPIAWLVCTEEGDPDMVFLSQHEAQQYLEDDEHPTPLYTHPSHTEGMVGWLQVYLCKIKSKKRIDKEIPRELQGWWADMAAGQKILLRQAVQSDLDRCNIGGKRSRNPNDYMCETHTGGSLVSKVALEYMSPEENVFAAPPTTAAGSGKGE